MFQHYPGMVRHWFPQPGQKTTLINNAVKKKKQNAINISQGKTPWRGRCSYQGGCVKLQVLTAMHRDILGSSSLIKKILWLRSSLPTSPRTFDQGWSPPHKGILSIITPVGWRRNAHSSGGRHTQFWKNVTLQALNLLIRHPVFLLESQELKLLPVSPTGKGIPTEMSKKALRISRAALWQTETTKLFLVCECESTQQPQIQSAAQSTQHLLLWGFTHLERCRAPNIHRLILARGEEPFQNFYTINYPD